MIKIKIEVSDTEEIELTIDQAKKLYQELGEILEGEQTFVPYTPMHPIGPYYRDYPPYVPDPPYTTYPTITCSSDDL